MEKSSRGPLAVAAVMVLGTVAAAVIGRHDVPLPIGPAPAPPAPAAHALLVFSEDACPWCEKLHAELQKPDAQAALQPFAVSEVRDRVKAWSWGVRAYPTMILTDAAGKELGRHEGYVDAHALAAWLSAYR